MGASFGLAFVFVNSGEPLPSPVAAAARVLAAVALMVVVVRAVLDRRRDTGDASAHATRARAMFGRGYLLVVATEVVLLVAGLAARRAAGAPVQANVAVIAVIVGAHLVALAVVWREASVAVPGVILVVLGGSGLVLVSTGTAVDWVPSISGVLSGLALLAGSVAATTRGRGEYPPSALAERR